MVTLTKRTALNVVCTLNELIGEKGKVFYNPNNFKGTARIFLDLQLEDGSEGTIYCSPAVSKHLREHTMNVRQLKGMPIVKGLTTLRYDDQGNPLPQVEVYTVSLPGATMEELDMSGPVEAWTDPNRVEVTSDAHFAI